MTVGVLVTVTCRTGIMMLVVYCLFVCAICLYFRLWVCNTVIGTVPVDGVGTASRGLVKVLICDSEELRNSRLCYTQLHTISKVPLET